MNLFSHCAVKDVSTIPEFLSRYYRADRYTGRGKEYAAALLNDFEDEFEEDGFVIISKHDSVTGSVVSFERAI